MNAARQCLLHLFYVTLLMMINALSVTAQVRQTKTAFIGSNVTLQCSKTKSEDNPIFWEMIKDGEDSKMMSFNGRLRKRAGKNKYAVEEMESYYYLLIYNVTPNDDADYVCYELFGEKNADTTSLVIYAVPSPLVITGWKAPVVLGDTVKLVCKSTGGRPQTALRWTKAGDSTRDLGGLVLNTKHTDGTFISRKVYSFPVTRTTLTDTFLCTGEIAKLGYNESKNASLDVKVPPLQPVIDGELEGDAGMSISTHCHSDAAKPRANITWWSDGHMLEGQLVILKNTDGTYNVTNIIKIPLRKESDNKLLTCKSTNEVLTRKDEKALQTSFTLTVNYKPVVSSKDEYVVDAGNHVTLKCEVEAKPAALISWMRNRNLIKSKKSRYELVLSNEFSYLTLLSVDKSDSGIYTCVAKNRLGVVKSETTLIVRHPPVITLMPAVKVGVLEHRSITLHCNIQAVPAQLEYVLWYHNSELLAANERFRFSEGNQSFTIHQTTRSDWGSYYCKARNELGETQSDDLLLQVEYIPENISLSSNSFNVSEHASIPSLRCSASAIPDATYLWRHDGKRIGKGEILHFPKRASHATKGNYSCTAKNKWGTLTTSIHINVFYSPVCQHNQKLKYGTALGKEVAVSCYVKANPPAVSFTWQLVNASRISNKSEVTVEGLIAFQVIRVEARVMADYGTVYCSATNGMGKMSKPCAIEIVQSGPPEAPRNCTVLQITHSSVNFRCSPGFDGGSKQSFLVQKKVYNKYVTLVRETSPSFILNNFEPNTSYRIRVCALNQEFPKMGACAKDITVRTKQRTLGYTSDSSGKSSPDAEASSINSANKFLSLHSSLLSLLSFILSRIFCMSWR